MRIRLSFLFIVFSFSFGLSQFNHYPVFPDLSDQQLINKLVEDYKTSTVLSYAEARDVMYAEIYNEDDNVSGIYTNHTLYLDPSAEPRAFLYMDGSNDGINCEHSFPRSKGADNGNPKSDIHHLFPSRSFVNNVRSSKPFAEIVDTQTDDWYFENQSQNSIPGNNKDLYSENDSNTFEPRESVKGNIARAMMYFYTMYKSEADNADGQFFASQIETLCEWHYDDPVDSLEYTRTWLIANYQDGKANPFVLDCSVAARSYCSMISDACRTVPVKEIETTEIKLYPNPSTNHINLEITGLNKVIDLKIYDGFQHLVRSFQHQGNGLTSFSHNLNPGFYFCQINIDGRIHYKSFIVL